MLLTKCSATAPVRLFKPQRHGITKAKLVVCPGHKTPRIMLSRHFKTYIQTWVMVTLEEQDKTVKQGAAIFDRERYYMPNDNPALSHSVPALGYALQRIGYKLTPPVRMMDELDLLRTAMADTYKQYHSTPNSVAVVNARMRELWDDFGHIISTLENGIIAELASVIGITSYQLVDFSQGD